MAAHIRCTLPSLALLHHKTSQTTHPDDNPVMSIYHTGQPYSNKIELHRYTIVWEKLVVGNIHETKICGKNFRLSRLQTIINYRIAGKFRGLQFSRISRFLCFPRKFLSKGYI